jgi:DNA repair protein RecO (recombination protein O)
MAAETLNAILLRRIRFSDTSLIVSWFSLERGKLKTVARGALRAGSSFAGKLDLFFQCELTVAWSPRSELHTLREAVLIDSFSEIRRNYANTLAASYFSELVEEVTELEHPEGAIYDLLVRAFRYLQTHAITTHATHFFEQELAKILGLESKTPNQSADHLLHSLQRTRSTRTKLLALLERGGQV